jgi:hypothetical protein
VQFNSIAGANIRSSEVIDAMRDARVVVAHRKLSCSTFTNA